MSLQYLRKVANMFFLKDEYEFHRIRISYEKRERERESGMREGERDMGVREDKGEWIRERGDGGVMGT